MSTQEAQWLLQRIMMDWRSSKVSIHRIGNGELVCLINNTIFVWDEEDWEQYRAAQQ